MKNRLIKSCLLLLLGSILVSEASAQRAPRRRPTGNAGQTSTNTGSEQEQQNSTRVPTNVIPGIPITVDSSGETSNTIKKSLRQDAAFDKSAINERTPLPYEHLRWDDALYTERVWRELDLREKMNKTFLYEAEDDNGSQMFINLLLKAVQAGDVTAFEDDRFTTPMAMDQITSKTQGTADTTPQYDLKQIDKIIGYKVTRSSFDPKTIMKLRMKEEWVFDREASRMFVRILGIAPVLTVLDPTTKKERGSQVLFWVYYPDLRPTLAKYEVYNSKNMGMGRMTWEELFESRMFSSYITKSTLDNPSNRLIRQMIKDPILALLEGENIKERIFNYEQDLWSY